MTRYQRLGGINQSNVLCHAAEAEIKVLEGSLLLGGHEGASVPCLPSLLVIVGVPWLVEEFPQSLPSFSHGVLPVCVSICGSTFPLLMRIQSCWIKAHPNDLFLI